MQQTVPRERDDVRRVDRARLEQLVRERTVEPRRRCPRASNAGRSAERTSEYPFACSPVEGSPITTSPSRDPVRPQERGFVDHPDAEAGEVEGVLLHQRPDARRSRHRGGRIPPGGIPPRRPRRSRRHSWPPPVRRPGSRGRTEARRPCRRRRRHTSPRGRSRPCRAVRSVARSRASSRRRRWPPRGADPRRSGRARRSHPPDRRPRDASRRGEVGDQGDRLRRGLGVDAGVAVGAAHAVGSRSWSSSTNLPACSGTGIGYSPSKQARQKSSDGSPVDRTSPSSEMYPRESAPT